MVLDVDGTARQVPDEEEPQLRPLNIVVADLLGTAPHRRYGTVRHTAAIVAVKMLMKGDMKMRIPTRIRRDATDFASILGRSQCRMTNYISRCESAVSPVLYLLFKSRNVELCSMALNCEAEWPDVTEIQRCVRLDCVTHMSTV